MYIVSFYIIVDYLVTLACVFEMYTELHLHIGCRQGTAASGQPSSLPWLSSRLLLPSGF